MIKRPALKGLGLVSIFAALYAVGVAVGAISPERAFPGNNATNVPMDFEDLTLTLNLDTAARTARGTGILRFKTIQDGKPYFLLNAEINAIRLDGQPVNFERVLDPQGDDRLIVVDANVSKDAVRTLEVDYQISDDNISFRDGGVGLVTAMADIDSGNFFENYGPANFEDDQYRTTATLNLSGATNPHQLFANGAVTQPSPTSWQIVFPDYFGTSSFYFHLTDAELAVRNTTYQGLEKEIPITVYAQSAGEADIAIERLPSLFAELERDYGPYLHNSFTAYISGAGGMEHGGATITSLSALGHELTHSWFGRGVIPSNGSSGWIDEAVATWRDNDYPRESGLGDLSSINIGALSPFERFTPFAAYAQGGELMAVLDGMFADRGGMKPLLREWYALRRASTVTTPEFEIFLEEKTGTDLTDIFNRFVLGREAGGTVGQPPGQPGVPGTAPQGTAHPPALTPQEVQELR